ncbi:MAG: glucosyltransferase [Thelocarpon impressellum]|nr:MAG: glucosyltransferase [Thelocarpon impressellum]
MSVMSFMYGVAIPQSVVYVLAGIWSNEVTRNVPDTYLDEVFHIPQAQAYCDGDWHIWDPKITTPPGLTSSYLKDFALVISGLVALSFRQTNIFWVAAFLGGLELVRTLKSRPNGATMPRGWGSSSYQDIITHTWTGSGVYDPTVDDAELEDYLKTGISLAVGACANFKTVVVSLAPYLTLLASFAGFVAWNGGVVLGDKSNHVATIHTPQMLYIWVFFAFFSTPLLLPVVLDALASLRLPRPSVLAFFLGLACVSVHFNTITHPFTLADNRHYVFYAFRWFLLRHPLARYVAAPGYLVCGWAAIQGLGRPPSLAPKKPSSAAGAGGREGGGNRVSFVLVFLATTTLALVTVPLVEPRYFIVPWVVWRLHLPLPASTNPDGQQRVWWKKATPLALETVWFMTINFVTGYAFLHRGFAWAQEPGRVQRFMW